MIISPPFLKPRQDGQTDEDWLLDTLGEITTEGLYPVTGSKFTWHNGIHLQAPNIARGDVVRAIADGVVLFRQPPQRPNDNQHDPQNYNPWNLDIPKWTDNGLVIIEHETDIGHGTRAQKITFYSAYMHMIELHPQLPAIGERIYRKTALGKAGRIYGHSGQIHLEICCDDASLEKIISRQPDWQDPAAIPTGNGRTDSVFGDIYIYLPADTPIVNQFKRPAHDHSAIATLGQPQWVQIHLEKGAAAIHSYHASGQQAGKYIGSIESEPNFEYNLYRTAKELHDSLADPSRSSPSGWYELLRFGRNLGRSATDRDPLPPNARHWRKIRTPSGPVWADLNAEGTRKFSDADFLPVMGWNCYGDDPDEADQRCQSSRLKAHVQDPQSRDQSEAALVERIQDSALRDKLKLNRAICKFASEWDASTIEQRCTWVQHEKVFNENPQNWDRFREHLQALACSQLPPAYKNAKWHFHPGEFIRVFRLCGWLSRNELIQLLPMNSLRKNGNSWLWESVGVNGAASILGNSDEAERGRTDLNRAMRKYCITNKERIACFFGNITQETQWFQKFHENSPYWYKPWDGRGFLQLTHSTNYIKYWEEFRSYQISSGDKDALKKHTILARNNRQGMFDPDNYLSDAKTGISQNLISMRNSIKTDTHSRADSAGAYWAWSDASKEADGVMSNPSNQIRTKNTTSGIKKYYLNAAFARVASTVNVGTPSNNYSIIWGIEARFMAYSNAAVVLLDMISFEYDDGSIHDTPQDWKRRLIS